MARYIDADKVMEEINRIGGHNLCEWETIGVKALIERQPTADVAPRAEVAREIFEEIEKKSCTISETYTAAGYTRVICYQISSENLEELKNKYAEGKDDT